MHQPATAETTSARLAGSRRLLTGLLITTVVVAAAAGAHSLARYGFNQTTSSGIGFDPLAGPSAAHPFGTDDQSFDIAARITWGARTAVASLGLGVTLGFVVGYPLGRLCRALAGRTGDILRAGADTLSWVPAPLVALALTVGLGGRPDQGVLAAGLGLSAIYVLAYLKLGRSGHGPRSFLSDIPAIGFLYAADAVGTSAVAGLLGLGPATRRAADWGSDLARGIDDAAAGIWWAALFPAVALITSALGFALVAHAINPRLPPALRRGNRRDHRKVP